VDTSESQQVGTFTIFAPSNDAMARLNQRYEDPNLLWKYHIVPGRYDDQTIYNMAQDKFNQANPRQMGNDRPQNNLATMAIPFQVTNKLLNKNFYLNFLFLRYSMVMVFTVEQVHI